MMQVRNPVWNKYGSIDCEINHEVYGWIPFTASLSDPEKHGRTIYAIVETMKPAEYVSPPPSDAELQLTGVDYQGVMISATTADQNGLTAVGLAINLQGILFPDTVFGFENGSVFDITRDNYPDLMAVWLPFRQSFF